jgi:hypothetical protein
MYAYRQTKITHFLSNTTIYILRYPFLVAAGMSSTRKFWNIYLNNMELHSLNEYVRIKHTHFKRKEHVRKAGLELACLTFASMRISHANHLSTNEYRWVNGT